MAALASFAEVVPLRELASRLREHRRSATPLVSITFDDGYANVHDVVLPILKRFQLPATVFVVTGCIDSPGPMPFDRWSRAHVGHTAPVAWRPLNWRELDACIASGLVTIGSHSHHHLNALDQTPAVVAAEAERSRDILRSRLGPDHADAFSYPYGASRLGHVPPTYVDAVKRAGYALAVSTDLGVVRRSTDVYRLPRIEAHAVDSPLVLRAKMNGTLAPYTLVDRLRRAQRAV
jgi:peptidoglycan/xylan/chitin deacetylase (PgdA/CDA1 family)